MSKPANAREWFRIVAKKKTEDAPAEADVLLYGDIGPDWWDPSGGITAANLIKQLEGMDVEVLNVRINSGGGSVFEGVAIYNALRRMKAKVITHNDGIAASIASLILMAGAEVHMAPNAFIMIHEPLTGLWGNARDFRKMADTLDQISEGSIRRAYARTKQSDEQLVAWMGEEKWLNSEEALEYGFVDVVSDGGETADSPQATVDIRRFKNAPEQIAARYTPKVKDELPKVRVASDEERQLVAELVRTQLRMTSV